VFPALKSQTKNQQTNPVKRGLLINGFCVDSRTHSLTLAKAKKMTTPLKIDDTALSARIDRLLGGLQLPSPEAQAVDRFLRHPKVEPVGPFKPDPAAFLDLIERRIAQHTASPIT
jgi:hypothetical protein